ncbi:molybdopterin-guanine dinucleotide biosynthesis protein [Nesterenkonia natronophila]|uniref:Molybdopterin-guanine dinucleotide biosynthesis protein n=1 Tax=Nesterenkonia natronophila TaxID=2174932 RepID=A0A3A4F1S2_9MICC|nr:molybdopterin-guanine dinucleotide biosynthesis protein [Nesterenkonia natronophila]
MHEAIEQWVGELTRHLEIEDTDVRINDLLKIAGEAAHTVVRPAAPVTTFLIGYVTGLAEASGQADYQKAQKAATQVTRNLLEQRSQAPG